MRKLNSITGEELLKTYILLFDERTFGKIDYEHFTKQYDIWLRDLEVRVKSNILPLNVSLSKTNYLGKKTSALLYLLEIKNPKNLTDLTTLLKERL